MTRGDVQWGFFAGASGVALIAAETAYVYDNSWATYQACQAFIIIEYASLAFTLCGKSLLEDKGTRELWKNLELVAAVLGIFASAKTGYALSSCVLDDDVLSERGVARECIDVYDSYAALDGEFGASAVCASLNKNIESPLGGTCPTISYSDEDAGKAVLGIQFGVVVVLTVLHFYKFMTTNSRRGEPGAYTQDLFPERTGSIFDLGTSPAVGSESVSKPAPRNQMTRTAFSARPFKTTSVYCSGTKRV
tara:strand:- start:5589 stop:6335 length:747 start_codon:yes stop_codon:yes gene_type:complete